MKWIAPPSDELNVCKDIEHRIFGIFEAPE